MTRRLLFSSLIILLVVLPLMTGCNGEETTSTPAGTTTPPTETATPTAAANWWDKWGEPEYGGTINLRATSLVQSFDVNLFLAEQGWFFWSEQLFINNQTVSPDVYPFKIGITPDNCLQGLLAEDWEMTDSTTLTVHIREGIHYANKAPANGREFTADDVQYHYDRMLGTGSGFTEPRAAFAAAYYFLEKVTATDKYTVVFTFSEPSALNFNLIATVLGNQIECRESVEAGGGSISDWETAVGTGAWILTDYVAGSSMTFSRNSDYWGYDDRHPENQLPYADTVKALMIPDISTALAAMRSGQVDVIPMLDWKQAQILTDTNPELQQAIFPTGGKAVQVRYDLAPFNDIRVRKALQMAVNLPEIAGSHYGGTVDPTPSGIISQQWQGYCYAYEDWPQSLKDEYSFNPEGAKQLLAEAAADGVFEVNDLGGFDTNCVAPTNADLELLQILKSYFLDIGVDMEIKTMEWVAWGNYVRAGEHDAMAMNAMGDCGMSGTRAMLDFAPGTVSNYSHVYEPEFEQLYSEFASATEFSQLAPIFRQVDQLYLEQHCRVQTFNINNYTIYQPYLKGYNGEDTMSMPIPAGWAIARFWIAQE